MCHKIFSSGTLYVPVVRGNTRPALEHFSEKFLTPQQYRKVSKLYAISPICSDSIILIGMRFDICDLESAVMLLFLERQGQI